MILPSRDGQNNGGSGGTIFDDNGSAFGVQVYHREHANPLPLAVTAIENYGRVYRLLKANVPVTLEVNIESQFTGDHEHGFNTIAEIPGTDPKLKDEVVMLGGHLDSWISATGATDNGAGSVVAMEVMRILTTLHIKPRRTIRVALWTGEEQGLFGSHGYVSSISARSRAPRDPEQLKIPACDAQNYWPDPGETRAGKDFRLFQRGQRQRQDSRNLSSAECAPLARFSSSGWSRSRMSA